MPAELRNVDENGDLILPSLEDLDTFLEESIPQPKWLINATESQEQESKALDDLDLMKRKHAAFKKLAEGESERLKMLLEESYDSYSEMNGWRFIKLIPDFKAVVNPTCHQPNGPVWWPHYAPLTSAESD